VIVPISRNDFSKLSDPVFLQLLACFGVNVNQPSQVYPRVDSSVQKEAFQQTLGLMFGALNILLPAGEFIDKQAVES